MSRVWELTPKTHCAGCGPSPATRPFDGELHPLDTLDSDYFSIKYELTPADTSGRILRRVLPGQGYVLPIFAPEGHIRGHVVRASWPGSPRVCVGCLKADTFMSKLEPVQGFYSRYRDGLQSEALVAVEDQLSAIKLAARGLDSVAMLGTPWSKNFLGYQGADRVAEMAHVAGDRELIVALDADATESAFEFARKWRYAFRKLRVAILSKDLKDTLMADITEVLGIHV